MAEIIDGKKISTDIKNEVKEKVEKLNKEGIDTCLNAQDQYENMVKHYIG